MRAAGDLTSARRLLADAIVAARPAYGEDHQDVLATGPPAGPAAPRGRRPGRRPARTRRGLRRRRAPPGRRRPPDARAQLRPRGGRRGAGQPARGPPQLQPRGHRRGRRARSGPPRGTRSPPVPRRLRRRSRRLRPTSRRLRRRYRHAPQSVPARAPRSDPAGAPQPGSANTLRSAPARTPQPGSAGTLRSGRARTAWTGPARPRFPRALRSRSVRAHRVAAGDPAAVPARADPPRRPGNACRGSAGIRRTVGAPPRPGVPGARRRAAAVSRAEPAGHSPAARPSGGAGPATPASRRAAGRLDEPVGAALATLSAVRGGDHPLRADLRGSDLPVPGSACRTHRPADATFGRGGGPADSRCPAGTPGPGCHPRSAGNVRSAARRPRSDAGTAPSSGRPTTAASGPRRRGAPSGARNAGGNTWNADDRARRRDAGARAAGGAARTRPGVPATAPAGHPAAIREAEHRGASSVRHPASVADAVGGSRATAAACRPSCRRHRASPHRRAVSCHHRRQ